MGTGGCGRFAASLPGQGQMQPDQGVSERLRREVTKLKAERDMSKKAVVGSAGVRNTYP